jgi:hypothetical protein
MPGAGRRRGRKTISDPESQIGASRPGPPPSHGHLAVPRPGTRPSRFTSSRDRAVARKVVIAVNGLAGVVAATVATPVRDPDDQAHRERRSHTVRSFGPAG